MSQSHSLLQTHYKYVNNAMLKVTGHVNLFSIIIKPSFNNSSFCCMYFNMKFLPEFALCWGGASITPTANDAAIPPHEEEQTRTRNSGDVKIPPSAMPSGRGRRVVKSRNGTNWKPALRVIAEERMMSDIVVEGNGERKERAAPPSSSCAKSAAKVKAKSIVRSKLSPRHGDDYWKSTSPMAVPAFAPTAFLF